MEVLFYSLCLNNHTLCKLELTKALGEIEYWNLGDRAFICLYANLYKTFNVLFMRRICLGDLDVSAMVSPFTYFILLIIQPASADWI